MTEPAGTPWYTSQEPVHRRVRTGSQPMTDSLDGIVSNPEALIGMTLGGRYVLQHHQGTGGMAIVYRAMDNRTNHPVAVKILRPDLVQQDPNYISRFQREAEAASRMTHHNIVNLLDVGQEGNIRYLVMEFVEGRTLKEVIEEHGRLSPETAVQFAIRILSALQHAHRQHIVHRDIKPQNILVDRQGYVKVADFGIARIASRQTLSPNDKVLGSVHYFSPEHAQGHTADERSDIYSVGVVLYEMLTGRLPFDAEDIASVALQQVMATPPPFSTVAPDVSPLLEAVVLKAMEKDPDHRYQKAVDMANDLQAAMDGRVNDMIARPMPNLPGRESTPAPVKKNFLQRIGKRRLLLWGVTALAVYLVFYGLYAGGMAIYDSVVNSTTVPDFLYMDIEAAQRAAEQRSLNVRTMETYDSNSAAGTVIQQAPQESTTLKKGDTVVLTVSKGPATLLAPKVVGMTLQDAIVAAQKVNLTLTVVERVVSADVQSDFIISQVPAANTQLTPEDTVLQVVISGGIAVVPDVVGDPLPDARAELGAAGLTVSGAITYVQTGETLLHGTVAGQTLTPGAQVMVNTAISLMVYQCPAMLHTGELTLSLQSSETSIALRVTVEENGTEMDMFTGDYPPEETRHPVIPITVQAAGTYTCRIYCNGQFSYATEIVIE